MAYQTSYTSLIADLQTYVDDTVDEFVAQVPAMVARAQDRIQLDLSLERWNIDVEDSLPAGQSTMSRRSPWLAVHSIFVVPAGKYAERRTPEWCRMLNASAASGHLRYWAENQEGSIMLSPRPLLNDAVVINVAQRLPMLTAMAPTNWIAENFAALLLWASLKECEHFLLSPERVAEFEGNYQQELTLARQVLVGTQHMTYGIGG